jgi:hypothetical protein
MIKKIGQIFFSKTSHQISPILILGKGGMSPHIFLLATHLMVLEKNISN